MVDILTTQGNLVIPPPGPAGQQRWSAATLEDILSGYFARLEQKIADNKKEAHDDFVGFWTVKGFIFAGTLGSGALQASGYGNWVPALCLVATVFAAIDAIRPMGTLYRAHRLAESDLTKLLEHVRTEWEIAQLRANPALHGADLRNAAVSILEKIAAKTDIVGRSVNTAEAYIDKPKASEVSQAA